MAAGDFQELASLTLLRRAGRVYCSHGDAHGIVVFAAVATIFQTSSVSDFTLLVWVTVTDVGLVNLHVGERELLFRWRDWFSISVDIRKLHDNVGFVTVGHGEDD